jgi:hypothetical protein
MMASRRLNRRQTNAVLAASMAITIALAVAFFVIAMPRDLLEGLVSATGLPAILSAAQPPLGETARLILAACGAGAVGAIVLGLFLLTDRQPARKADKPESGNPFFADLDLPVEPKPEPVITMPSFARSAAFELQAEPVEPLNMSEIVETIELTDVIEEPVADAPVAVEPDPVAPQKDAPIFLDFKAMRAGTPPSNDPSPLDLGQWKFADSVQEEKPAPPRPITAPARQSGQEESISDLMARIEIGLERRAVKGAAPTVAPAIDRSGVGLKSTLEELRKMAVRR